MPTRRMWTLLSATLVGLASGTNYIYSAYAPQLAQALSLTSTQTNVVGAFGNAGVYLSSPFIGRIVDRKGPTGLLLFGALAVGLGYLSIRALYEGGEAGLFTAVGVPGLAIAEMLVGVGSTAALSAAGNSVAKSFLKNRATALSAVLSAFGLSAFFFSTILRTYFRNVDDPMSAFLLLLALGCGGAMLLGAIFVRPVPHPSLASPATREDDSPVLESVVEADETTPLVADVSAGKKTDAGELVNVSGWNLLAELDFWLLFAFNGLCAGVGLMYINNLGTIARALASPSSRPSDVALSQASLVSLLSAFNCLGRLVTGSLSDYGVHRAPRGWKWSRVWWNVSTASIFLLSQVFALAATSIHGWHGLAIPTILTGFAHGSLFGISGVLVLERFGIKSFGSNNGLLSLAPAIFGQSSNYMFGRIYDHHVPSSSTALAGRFCTAGRSCYASAFHVTIGMALTAVGVGIVLSSRASMKRRAD